MPKGLAIYLKGFNNFVDQKFEMIMDTSNNSNISDDNNNTSHFYDTLFVCVLMITVNYKLLISFIVSIKIFLLLKKVKDAFLYLFL